MANNLEILRRYAPHASVTLLVKCQHGVDEVVVGWCYGDFRIIFSTLINPLGRCVAALYAALT